MRFDKPKFSNSNSSVQPGTLELGFFISLTYIANFFFFSDSGLLNPHSLFLSTPRVPWPIFPLLHLNLLPAAPVVSWIVLILGILSAFGYFLGFKHSYALLALALVAKLSLYFSDFRLMGNYHLMQHWFTILFLISKAPAYSLRILVCFFYFFAGTLKLNQEWLVGESLLGLKWQAEPYIKIPIMFSVILLELFVIWGLAAGSRWFAALTLVCLLIFHSVSVFFIQLYYPTIMLLLLGPFFLQVLNFSGSWNSAWRGVRGDLSGLAGIAIFVGLQLIPYMSPGTTALTGEGRLWSLNMLDVRPECHAVLHQFDAGETTEIDLGINPRVARGKCDPAFLISQLRSYCERRTAESPTPSTFALASKRATDTSFTPVLWSQNICADAKAYSALGRNSFFSKASHGVFTRTEDPISPSSTSQNGGDPQNWRFSTWTSPSKELKTSILIDTPLNLGIHKAVKSTPVADKLGFYVAGDTGMFLAVDFEGKIRWKFIADTPLGIHSSPVIFEDSVLIGTYGGRLYKFKRSTGELIWWSQLGSALGATPKILNGEIYANVEYSNPPRGQILKLNRDGKIIWKSALLMDNSHSTPAFSNDGKLILVGDNTGTLSALSTKDGKEVWSRDFGLAIKSSILIVGGNAYIASWNSQLLAVEVRTGKLINSIPLSDRSMSSPSYLAATEEIFISTIDGKFYWIRIPDLKVTAQNEDGETEGKSSAVAFKTSRGFYGWMVGCKPSSVCLYNQNHKLIAREPAGGVVNNSVAFSDHGLMVSPLNSPGPLILALPPY